MILRPYQEQMVSKAVAALKKHGDTLAVAPTGAAKRCSCRRSPDVSAESSLFSSTVTS